MIHPETREHSLAEEAQAAYLKAHPRVNRAGMHNDLAAIEWRHGYITGARKKSAAPSAPEQEVINRFGIFDEENAS